VAGRPEKYTISYFPHYVKDSRTLYTLENEYAAEGYMFWFKLLEFLCNSPGLSYDCSKPTNFKYLCAKTKVKPELANRIMDTLSDLNKIDSDLWQNKVIWCQQLVDNVEDVFKRRKADMPIKPIYVNINSISANINPINVELLQHDVNNNAINVTQTKLNEIKENKKKENHTLSELKTYSDDSIEIVLSKYLYEKIIKNAPKVKEPNYQLWAKHIDLMIRVDGREPNDIKDVIDWCQADSFWTPNILSTGKLREKFDILYAKMIATNKGGNNGKSKKHFASEREYSEAEQQSIDDRFYS
jgi:hypothetical protein